MSTDGQYLQIIQDCVRTCLNYKPKFGKGGRTGVTLGEFRNIYQGDLYYQWFGLDDPLMYTAHKTAGGMTSIYRQIGIGCERVFRSVLKDTLGLSEQDIQWSYEVPGAGRQKRNLSLDGRVRLDRIQNSVSRKRFRSWMRRSADALEIDPSVFNSLKGVVFEVRQGYKSKDSKRQNADIANASAAYVKGYLPCVIVFSNQIDEDILIRYRAEKWMVLTGVVGLNDALTSTYDFMRECSGIRFGWFF